MLNLLLAGTTNFLPDRRRHFWARVQCGAQAEFQWVQEYYFTNFGEAVLNELSRPIGQKLEEIDSDRYYEEARHDGRGLSMPHDLDDLICRYQSLLPALQAKFDRATRSSQQTGYIASVVQEASRLKGCRMKAPFNFSFGEARLISPPSSSRAARSSSPRRTWPKLP